MATLKRKMALWGLAILATACWVAPVEAADVPSFDEIKSRLKQQREKLQSLYIEVKSEDSSPLSIEEYRKLPFSEGQVCFPTEEIHFGFKDDKRYLRTKQGEIPDFVPAAALRPNATEQEKKQHERYVEREKKRRALPGPRTTQLSADRMVGYDGKVIWTRTVSERRRADGKTEKRRPEVATYSPGSDTSRPTDVSRFIRPPGYLFDVGLAVFGPDFSAQDKFSQDAMRLGLLPELFELGKFSIDGTENIDGAKCVRVCGTVELKRPGETTLGPFADAQKLWLDVEHGLAVRKREWVSAQRRTRILVLMRDFQEVTPGLWLPKVCQSQTIAPPDDPDYPEQVRGKPFLMCRIKLTRWIINQMPDDLFDVLVKPGDEVIDARGEVFSRKGS
jgi:hypothetical protein